MSFRLGKQRLVGYSITQSGRVPPLSPVLHQRVLVLDLSIIIPTFDEEENVGPLYDALTATVPALGRSFEIIFVDDGSRDRTFARLMALAARDPRVRVIKLRRNCGQTPAMAAGIDHAQGHVLVTMDADLQNDPADIGGMLAKLEQGYDLVVGWRQDRQDSWLSRKLPSMIANRLIAAITGVDVKDNGCTLKAFRADLIKNVPLYGEMHRFIPAMTSTIGCQLAEVGVRHHPRRFGTSKYGLSRIYRVLLDIITIKTLITFARRPLFCFFSIAAVALAVNVAFTVLAILLASGPAVVFMSVAVLGGSLTVFLASAGVISSLVSQYSGDHLSPLQSVTQSGVWSDAP
jgi:glycosyltransferase involved in cell wall biosynthesis